MARRQSSTKKKKPKVMTAHDLRLRPGAQGVEPAMRMEFINEDGDIFADFILDTASAETVCITLAYWTQQQLSPQNAPTSTTLQ